MMIKRIIHNNNYSIYTDEAIYYGIKVISFNVLSIFTILFIGFITNDILFSIIFLISFIPERLIIDGYHCKNILRCEITFSLSYFIIWALNKIVYSEVFFYFLLLLTVFYLLIQLLYEKKYFKEKEIVIIIIYLIIIVFLFRKVYYFKIIVLVFIFNIILKQLKLSSYFT